MSAIRAIIASLTGVSALSATAGAHYLGYINIPYADELTTKIDNWVFGGPDLTYWTKKLKASTASSGKIMTRKEFKRIEEDLKCLSSAWDTTTSRQECKKTTTTT